MINGAKAIAIPPTICRRRYNNIIFLDEFRTSLVCSKTKYTENKNENDIECKNLKLYVKYKSNTKNGTKREEDGKIRKLHSVLTFKMGINRDKNAVYNFRAITKSLIETKKRPAIFSRNKTRKSQ